MEMSKRAFCLSAAAGVSLGAVGAPARAARSPRPVSRAAIAAFVYDARDSEARVRAEWWRRRGAAPFAIEGDSIALWYGDLGDLVRRTGGGVAGLTTYADLVIARSCGRELALRCVLGGAWDAGISLEIASRRYAPQRPNPSFDKLCVAAPLEGERPGDRSVAEREGIRPCDFHRRLTSWLLDARAAPPPSEIVA